MMKHAESVAPQILCEKSQPFLTNVLVDRMMNVDQKVLLKLPGVARHFFAHTFLELLATDAPFSPVLASQELHCHTFVSH